jgi:hypothetical protein
MLTPLRLKTVFLSQSYAEFFLMQLFNDIYWNKLECPIT